MYESAHLVEVRDPELIRILLLYLSKQERSPPEAIFLSMADLSAHWETGADDVASALEFLFLRGLIEGPGWFEDSVFLFRKVTAKGRTVARAIRNPRDWTTIKAHYFTSGDN